MDGTTYLIIPKSIASHTKRDCSELAISPPSHACGQPVPISLLQMLPKLNFSRIKTGPALACSHRLSVCRCLVTHMINFTILASISCMKLWLVLCHCSRNPFLLVLATIALAGPVSRGADSKNKPNNTHDIADGMAKREGGKEVSLVLYYSTS